MADHYEPENKEPLLSAAQKVSDILGYSREDIYYRWTLDPEYYSEDYDEESMADDEFALGVNDGEPLVSQQEYYRELYDLTEEELAAVLSAERYWD